MFRLKLIVYAAIFIILLSECCIVFSQDQEKNEPPEIIIEKPEDDILKISSELIQTGITVFDKKGRFVDNLKQEDFELRVDGKLVTISFFEKFLAENNESSITTKQNNKSSGAADRVAVKPNVPGRTFIFVVDDFHLSLGSYKRTRDLINRFIDREMLSEDMVAVVSPSGKIGFLQQFTNDKTVLRMAVERLIYNRNRSAADTTYQPMSEYEALLIDRGDREITDIFARLLARDMPGVNFDNLREQVRSRARRILLELAQINLGTYSVLEQAVRNSARLSGRKVVFFISDGFLLDQSNSNASYRLRRITDAAARTNTVIYSFDAKGIEAGLPENTSASNLTSSAGFRVQSGERFESQDGLSELAASTGGKFIRNTNDLQAGLSDVLKEVSSYYLLAWEPVFDNDKSDKLKRIEVIIKGRTDLQVRMQTGYLSENSKEAERNEKKQDKSVKKTRSIVDTELNSAIIKPIPLQDLPTSLVVNYIDTPNESALLAIAVQIKKDALEFTREAEKATAKINLLGVIYNAEGQREGFFSKILTVNTAVSELNRDELPPVFYNHQLKLKPGLYQIRVASRGDKTARVGSAIQWILVPDLNSRKLVMSSLLISEQSGNDNRNSSESIDLSSVIESGISVDRRFSISSKLRYLVFIYNANQEKTGTNLPEVFVQTRVLRGSEVVLSSAMTPVSANGQDPKRIPYAAEVPLDGLSSGSYQLQVTIEDRRSKTSIERVVKFEVY